MTNAAIPSASLTPVGAARSQALTGSGSTSTLFQELMQILAGSSNLPGAVAPAKTGDGTSSTDKTSGAVTGSASKHLKKQAVQQLVSAFIPQAVQPLQAAMADESHSSKAAAQNGTSTLRPQILAPRGDLSSRSESQNAMNSGFLRPASPKGPVGQMTVKQAVEQLHRAFPDITSVVIRTGQQRDVVPSKSTQPPLTGKGPATSSVGSAPSSRSSLPGSPERYAAVRTTVTSQQGVATEHPKSGIRQVSHGPVVNHETVPVQKWQPFTAAVGKSLGPSASATPPLVDNTVAAGRQANAFTGLNPALSVRQAQKDVASEALAGQQARQQPVHSTTEKRSTSGSLPGPVLSKAMQFGVHTDAVSKIAVQRAGPQPQPESSLAVPQASLPTVQTPVETTGTPATLSLQGSNLYSNFAALVQHQVANQVQTLQVQVHPQGLGSITVSVTHQAQGLAVQVTATNPATAAWLQQDSAQLLQAVQAAGVQVSAVNVGLTGQQSSGQQRRSHSGKDQSSPWAAPVERTRAAGQAVHGHPELAGGSAYTISLQA